MFNLRDKYSEFARKVRVKRAELSGKTDRAYMIDKLEDILTVKNIQEFIKRENRRINNV